jgi:hypothetical protein
MIGGGLVRRAVRAMKIVTVKDDKGTMLHVLHSAVVESKSRLSPVLLVLIIRHATQRYYIYLCSVNIM